MWGGGRQMKRGRGFVLPVIGVRVMAGLRVPEGEGEILNSEF